MPTGYSDEIRQSFWRHCISNFINCYIDGRVPFLFNPYRPIQSSPLSSSSLFFQPASSVRVRDNIVSGLAVSTVLSPVLCLVLVKSVQCVHIFAAPLSPHPNGISPNFVLFSIWLGSVVRLRSDRDRSRTATAFPLTQHQPAAQVSISILPQS